MFCDIFRMLLAFIMIPVVQKEVNELMDTIWYVPKKILLFLMESLTTFIASLKSMDWLSVVWKTFLSPRKSY